MWRAFVEGYESFAGAPPLHVALGYFLAFIAKTAVQTAIVVVVLRLMGAL